ncbi:MAG: 50S ribosomal protein L6 [Candidatus Doudnabacteria bacterium]|nr:50S ribosomal protein L6 [Candidatus Doudnabacteria bacterium]
MSRIGKKPVIIPSGVKVELKGSSLSVTGTKGVLALEIHPKVKVMVAENQITVDIVDRQDKRQKALWGLSRALINNLIEGVTKGFEKKLEVNGVGFKVITQGQKIVMSLGFSHPVEVEIPKDLSVTVDKNVIIISGADKQKVGQFAAEIRELKKPEPYKGKGIRYMDEVILRKAGKVVKVVGGGK